MEDFIAEVYGDFMSLEAVVGCRLQMNKIEMRPC